MDESLDSYYVSNYSIDYFDDICIDNYKVGTTYNNIDYYSLGLMDGTNA